MPHSWNRLCTEDERICKQLDGRRAALRDLFADLRPASTRDEQTVLVDAQRLTQFLSCSPSQSSDKTNDVEEQFLIRSEDCRHELMHPRDVRRGKLLSKPLFDRLAAIIRSEINASADEPITDVALISSVPSVSLCHECAETHVIELAQKVETLEEQNELLSALDDARGRARQLNEGDEAHGSDKPDLAYAVSKSFDKQFRAHMQRVVKSIGSSECMSIDAVDCSVIKFCLDSSTQAASQAGGGNEDSEAQAESYVNCSITCKNHVVYAFAIA